MSDSGDSSDVDPRPSCSKSRNRPRSGATNANASRCTRSSCGNDAKKMKKRRIVMRIEFDDSEEDEESSSTSDVSSDENAGSTVTTNRNDLDEQPSCSSKNRRTRANKRQEKDNGNESDEICLNIPRRQRNRHMNALYIDGSSSDGSSSSSEINQRIKNRSSKTPKKIILSDDEQCPQKETVQSQSQSKEHEQEQGLPKSKEIAEEAGFTSDSSSNELLEKCPICLLTFRQQEVGSPATCDHMFCANCIEAWSKNVQTCPIDRIEFDRIIVRESYENRRIVREINVDPNKINKELPFEGEEIDADDVTYCEICNSPDREDVMLLCDECNQGYHMDCLIPPLSAIPEGSWYCDNCFDPSDESEADGLEEDLNLLYEDIRDMGIPQAALRVTEVHQPRILRTRQNERIRAAVLRTTRSTAARIERTTTTTTNTSRQGRQRTSTTTATTRTTRTKRTTKPTVRRKGSKRRRRRTRKRTYVVEYDLNNFDEKFAIKTTKKVIKRRRRKRKASSRKTAIRTNSGERMTASKRLAEQMGVKKDPTFTSRLSGASAGLSLFGGPNDLEYFSDSDNGGIEHEIELETGHGTAVQTSIRISNFGTQRSRKGLLFGRLQGNRRITEAAIPNNTNSDLLSSIMDLQDRWHSAAQNLENVHINPDGTLNLPSNNNSSNGNNLNSTPEPLNETRNNATDANSAQVQNSNPNEGVTQAPMYSRGGGNPNFGGGSGGGGGNYNRFNNQNNYHGGGGGGGNHYRHSTGGSIGGGSNSNIGGGNNFGNMVGRGNFNFSNQNVNNNPNSNFSPFSIRFNQRNQRNNNLNNNNSNQRNSLPFVNRNDESDMQQQPQNLSFNCPPPQPPNINFNQPPQMQQNTHVESNLFGGLPPPMSAPNESQLFTGIPPPLAGSMPIHSQPPMQEALNASNAPITMPPLMSIPPPPAPPPAVHIPWSNSLFQLNTDYANDDDDSNCPNFSVYSAESQEVAKSTELQHSQQDGEPPKEDDENEDLVQLDDDDEIPMPPETNPTTIENSDLYEPENPTEENDDEEEEGSEENKNVNDTNTDKDKDKDKDVDMPKVNDTDSTAQYDPEQEVISQSNDGFNIEVENIGANFEESKSNDECDQNEEKTEKSERSPSPALSEIKLPESEASVANRKGVLELYDDSDWEELEIDKPKGYEKSVKESDKAEEEEQEEGQIEPSNPADEDAEPDRSYTPCLDENNEPDEVEIAIVEQNASVSVNNSKENDEEPKEKSPNPANDSSGIAGMETELISDEEETSRGAKSKRRGEKRDKRDKRDKGDKGNAEIFKKVSDKQKERNYRGEKQVVKRKSRRRVTKSRSRSRSRSRSPSRPKSRSVFRSRSRSRSRARFRKRSRDRPMRSRSRSNNKENYSWRQGRFGGQQFRWGQRSRPKRRELPRYDVRNVVGIQRNVRDRYGRDTSRQLRSRSFSHGRRNQSFSRSRSHSISPKRNRRCSFSISPSPQPVMHRHSISPHRFRSPRRRSVSPQRITPIRPISRSPMRMRSRSLTPMHRMNGRKVTRHMRGGSPLPRQPSRSQMRSPSLVESPRYTPRLNSRSKSPPIRLKGNKKKKGKDRRKKKTKKRVASISPDHNIRISRQKDPFLNDKPPKKKRRHSPKEKSPLDEPSWSPSPSPPAVPDYERENNISWTPPLLSPQINDELRGIYEPEIQRSGSRASKHEKRKRIKKKKKVEKRRDGRKEKRRTRRTETPELAPSKEVFASGNNILVSVSFNKEAANQQQQPQQTTVVTLPPSREDLLTNRRTSIDRVVTTDTTKKKKDKSHKRKKIDAKPVAIIDLERSPFQVHQEPADIIVLTDSEDAGRDSEHERRRDRDRRRSESGGDDIDHHRQQLGSNRSTSQHDKTPPMERLDTILEESYDLPQTGPKTPPEPPVVKFNMPAKKQNKVRNPLHDETEIISESELPERQDQEPHRPEMEAIHVQNSQKIGPNTPPESGPCSPDAYDPFDPTKSPSLSPRSPTPPVIEVSQTSISDGTDAVAAPKHISDDQRHSGERNVPQIPGGNSSVGTQGTSMNPVELVMALMSTKQNNSQDLANKSNESQFSNSSHMLSSSMVNAHDDSLNMRDKADETNGITVLSNVLLSSQSSQHIPVISSPTPVVKSNQIMKLPLPKVGGSVGSSSGVGLPSIGSNNRNGIVDIDNDIESPYSPGSADYEDLFEPPPETSSAKRRQKRSTTAAGGKTEIFDNLFGSTSPIGHLRLPSYTASSRKHKSLPIPQIGGKKSKVKVGKSDDHIKIYDDVPNSAVELQVKDKFLRKLNRQERVVEEVKLVLKPRFNKKQITKEDYKEIMRRAVPKICHSRSGEINPHKIKNLIDAYVKKFRAKHKKLNLINTGQVSSAVKCAAYLKKL